MAEWDDWERDMEEDQWNRDMQMMRDNQAWRDDAAWARQWQQWQDDLEEEDFEIERHRTPGRSRSVTPIDPMNRRWVRDFAAGPWDEEGRGTPSYRRERRGPRRGASGNYEPWRGVYVPRGRRSLRRGRGRFVGYRPWRSEL